MQTDLHRILTEKVFDIVIGFQGDHFLFAKKSEVADGAYYTDKLHDLEFVDVNTIKGVFTGGTGRDNPHADDTWGGADSARYDPWSFNVTAFNHFIDIRKGQGYFDDYDGYSYQKGSGKFNEFQTLSDLLAKDYSDWFYHLGWVAGNALKLEEAFAANPPKVDEALMWFFKDEYVHAPGHPWYRQGQCSPAIERYCYCSDKGVYSNVEAEAPVRFPLAEWDGGQGKGIPYSVFMPVDNLARFWYNRFLSAPSSNAWSLGPVMHAIQDASIPQHAAGILGNWHSRYEHTLTKSAIAWFSSGALDQAVQQLLPQWDHNDPSPPVHLSQDDWKKTPANNWPIEQLVTWVALNAYEAYTRDYSTYVYGFSWNEESALNLFQIATAMSAHVLRNLFRQTPEPTQDPCQQILDKIEIIQGRINAAEHNLNRNLSEASETSG